jgi:hypothetical protein
MTLTLLNEWLEKQSPAMLEAKRRGLVPQSGDWERPYRWVRPEEADVGSKDATPIHQQFLDLDYQSLWGASVKGKGKKTKEIIKEMIAAVSDLREENMEYSHQMRGQFLFDDWVEGMFARIVGLRAILLENEGKEISRDLVAQQMGAVNKKGTFDYEQVDSAIGFGKTMLESFNQETKEVSIQPTLDVLEAEHKFAVERTRELFGDEIKVYRCMYGSHVPDLKKQLNEVGELEIDEFPLSSYTQDKVSALAFCLGQGAKQPHMIFSRTIKAEEVMTSWYSNPAFLTGMPEQKEVVISSKEGKFTLRKEDIIGY